MLFWDVKMAKGFYTPQHPQKYLGDPRKIRFLSSWELAFMHNCDVNPNIIQWGSEEFKVRYFHPIKKKVCSYIPDFIVKVADRNGNVTTQVIEIKPMKQAVPSNKMSVYDTVQLIINRAKWTAAIAICEKAGIKFRVLTEDELFTKKRKR
jgi:hypothetical protein